MVVCRIMLQPHHFTYKCPLKLSDLNRVDGGYYCSQCRKDIHDLTDCSMDEIRDLQKRHGAICGFIRVVGVSSMLSLAACSKAGSDGKQGGQEPGTNNPPTGEEQVIMGDVCEMPEPPKPEAKAPEEQPPVEVEPEEPVPPKEGQPQVIQPAPIEAPPVIMGMICVPEHLNPPVPPEEPVNPPA